MYRSYLQSIGYHAVDRRGTDLTGSGVTVGIVDSLCGCDNRLDSRLDVSNCVCHYTATDERDPTGHGTAVLDSFTHVADGCTFQFFQALEDHGDGAVETTGSKTRGRRSDILDAVADAAANGVDVLNLSLGIPHECRGYCSLAEEVSTAVDRTDVVVVAAAGNRADGGTRGVHCPALSESVVSVAGYVSRCEYEPTAQQSSGQWWLRDDDGILGPFCGWRFCTRGPVEPCSEHRCETAWSGNVRFHNDFPDVAAPAVRVCDPGDGTVDAQAGTSFAAPIVAAAVCAFRGLWRDQNGSPTAAEIRDRLWETGSSLDDRSELRKLDCETLFASVTDAETEPFG